MFNLVILFCQGQGSSVDDDMCAAVWIHILLKFDVDAFVFICLRIQIMLNIRQTALIFKYALLLMFLK